MKNYRDLGGCYPPRPTASTDNTLLYLHNHFKRYSASLWNKEHEKYIQSTPDNWKLLGKPQVTQAR